MSAEKKCSECARTSDFDGCSHVECPERKPWRGGGYDDLQGITTPMHTRTGADGRLVQVGSSGCYRTPAKRGAQ